MCGVPGPADGDGSVRGGNEGGGVEAQAGWIRRNGGAVGRAGVCAIGRFLRFPGRWLRCWNVVERKDGGLTSLWLEAERSVYPFVYQGRKYMKNKGSLLITNQPLYQLS